LDSLLEISTFVVISEVATHLKSFQIEDLNLRDFAPLNSNRNCFRQDWKSELGWKKLEKRRLNFVVCSGLL